MYLLVIILIILNMLIQLFFIISTRILSKQNLNNIKDITHRMFKNLLAIKQINSYYSSKLYKNDKIKMINDNTQIIQEIKNLLKALNAIEGKNNPEDNIDFKCDESQILKLIELNKNELLSIIDLKVGRLLNKISTYEVKINEVLKKNEDLVDDLKKTISLNNKKILKKINDLNDENVKNLNDKTSENIEKLKKINELNDEEIKKIIKKIDGNIEHTNSLFMDSKTSNIQLQNEMNEINNNTIKIVNEVKNDLEM